MLSDPLQAGCLHKGDTGTKAGNTGQIVGAGFKPFRKIIGLLILIRTAAGTTGHNRPELHTRPNRQKTGSLGAQQPLVARCGQQVNTDLLHVQLLQAGRLGRIQQQQYPGIPGYGSYGNNILNTTGDVGHMGNRNHPGGWAQGCTNPSRIHQPLCVALHDGQYNALFFQQKQRTQQ